MNSISREENINRANPISRTALGISLLVFAITVALPSQSQPFRGDVLVQPSHIVPGKVFVYDSVKRMGATGVINHSDASFKTLDGPRGDFSPWTIVVSGGVDILFYDGNSGHAAIGQVNSAGVFRTTTSIPNGQIEPGYTHITFHKGFYLLYRDDTGFARVGNVGPSGFRFYNTWNGSFPTHWSHIVSTPNGLLFYNQKNGSGEVAEWDPVRTGGGFGQITQVNLKRLKPYPGGFDRGWTALVNTSRGVLFYRKDAGRSVMVDVDTDGTVTTRSRSEKTIPTGYDSILSQNDDVLLYDKESGDVIIASFPDVLSLGNSMAMRKTYSAYFSPGWSSLVATVDPTIIH